MKTKNIQLNLEAMRKMHIYLATPMYGGQCYGLYTKSLMDFSLDEALNNTDIPFALVIGFIWIRNKAKVNWSSIHSKALHLETLRKHYKNPDNNTNSL